MKNYLFGHYNEKTALEVKDYPYGFRLRTSIFYWIETEAKKGDRFCSYTINPKNGRINKPKKSTYTAIGVMYRDEETGYIDWTGVNQYTDQAKVEAFVNEIGGQGKLNAEQRKQYQAMTGKLKPVFDEFTGKNAKDFSIKWEKFEGLYDELKITFDRPDGVSIREMFEALKTVNQEKLKQVFEGRESKTWGHIAGSVRICIRGGFQLCTVTEDQYKEYLASDYTQEEPKAIIEI